MPKPKDVDFCQLVIQTVLHDGHTLPQVTRLLHSKTVRTTVARYLAGEPLALQGRKGVKPSTRKCSAAVQAGMLKLLKQAERVYLDELAAEVQARTGTCISVPGVQSSPGDGLDPQEGDCAKRLFSKKLGCPTCGRSSRTSLSHVTVGHKGESS